MILGELWKLHDDARRLLLSVTSDTPPKSVSAWMTTAATRDFRESKWTSQPMSATGGAYQYELPVPAVGFAAMFGEAVFDEQPDAAHDPVEAAPPTNGVVSRRVRAVQAHLHSDRRAGDGPRDPGGGIIVN